MHSRSPLTFFPSFRNIHKPTELIETNGFQLENLIVIKLQVSFKAFKIHTTISMVIGLLSQKFLILK